MRTCIATIKGVSPYSASRLPEDERRQNEEYDDFEKRIWREKAHVNSNGAVFIPGAGFKLALDDAAKVLKMRVKGRGVSTYTKPLQTGVCVMADVQLGIKKDELQSIRIHANADGKRGGGTRVWKWFPIVPEWNGQIEFALLNDEIPDDVFEKHVIAAGKFIGVGRGRPGTGSPAGNGRFIVEQFDWSNEE